MTNDPHKPSRPNFLRRGPGLLDMLYDAWCKASERLGHFHGGFDYADTPLKVPSYIHPENANVVCVHTSRRKDLIEPFCIENDIIPLKLYLGFEHTACMKLNRQVLENLVDQAIVVAKNKSADPIKRRHAIALIEAFEFLKAVPTTPHPKIDPVWHHHNQ